jgi:hypothetical protein
MKKFWWVLMACVLLLGLLACGTSKDAELGRGPAPEFEIPKKGLDDPQTLILKSEALKLTHVSQERKVNILNHENETAKYIRLQKKFVFPIQFNGWIMLENVEHNFLNCSKDPGKEPLFVLEDDHNGAVLIRPHEKVPVVLEKLYRIRVELENISSCNSLNIQFGLLYGANE